jgi:hypothetical protein
MQIDSSDMFPTADEFLFNGGLKLEDYFLERTPVSEMVCFENKNGRVFDLSISNPQLKSNVIARLVELGVRIVDRS